MQERAADQAGRRCAHAARTGMHAGERVVDPGGNGAGEQRPRVALRQFENLPVPAHGAIHPGPAGQQAQADAQAQADLDHEAMPGHRSGASVVAGTEHACHRCRHPAAHGRARQLHHQHRKREHQRYRGQRLGAQARDDEAVIGDGQCLRKKAQHIRARQTHQGGYDRAGQQVGRFGRHAEACLKQGRVATWVSQAHPAGTGTLALASTRGDRRGQGRHACTHLPQLPNYRPCTPPLPNPADWPGKTPGTCF